MNNETLARAVKRCAWAYVFYFLDFNLNINGLGINLLPDWAAYAFIIAALPGVAAEQRSAALLKPLAWALLLWEAAQSVFNLIHLELPSGAGYILNAVFSVIALYAHFQLFTELAQIADAHGTGRGRRIRLLRNIIAVANTAAAALSLLAGRDFYFSIGGSDAVPLVLAVFAVVFCFAVAVWCELFRLARALSAAGGEEEGEGGGPGA